MFLIAGAGSLFDHIHSVEFSYIYPFLLFQQRLKLAKVVLGGTDKAQIWFLQIWNPSSRDYWLRRRYDHCGIPDILTIFENAFAI
jgi:hypothetical protein